MKFVCINNDPFTNDNYNDDGLSYKQFNSFKRKSLKPTLVIGKIYDINFETWYGEYNINIDGHEYYYPVGSFTRLDEYREQKLEKLGI